ncbi:AcrR family transcriptional regulator [Diaminobutyricimonas aerilata]|uniref:AcrR family transcriptional regulator n=1 Tax=Diaminobutyricimonas aerilata TaxID=1162967 RepID=A0A2M9CJ80_9MICO|nr:TetR/AcrR family transcriptional regulator [Diaminobutyricimonas aerilata]PJJ71959.1 AcrR family transcriptional regulator [Diaminobutyricimonas aerilata]
MPAEDPRVGRPRSSSRATLEEAATELFLEQGYEATTVGQIARRAGVSRTSFFNYFPTKADVVWVAVDDALDALRVALAGAETAEDVFEGVLAVGARVDAQHVPLAITETEAMGGAAEIEAAGLARAARLGRELRDALGRGATLDAETTDVIARMTAGAVAAAWQAWAGAGVRRGELRDRLARALDLVRSGVREAVGESPRR